MSFWTDEHVAYLRGQAPFRSASQIAKALGCTRNAVIGKCGRLSISLGKPGSEPAPTPLPKPAPAPELIAVGEIEPGKYKETRRHSFRARCAACRSYSDELHWGARGVKQAATVLRRIGWRLTGMGHFSRWTCATCEGAVPAPVLPKPRQIVVTRLSPPIVCEPVEPKAIHELGDRDCVWPLGDPMSENFRYCAAPKADQRYCGAHAALSRGTGTPSERTAHKFKRSAYR